MAQDPVGQQSTSFWYEDPEISRLLADNEGLKYALEHNLINAPGRIKSGDLFPAGHPLGPETGGWGLTAMAAGEGLLSLITGGEYGIKYKMSVIDKDRLQNVTKWAERPWAERLKSTLPFMGGTEDNDLKLAATIMAAASEGEEVSQEDAAFAARVFKDEWRGKTFGADLAGTLGHSYRAGAEFAVLGGSKYTSWLLPKPAASRALNSSAKNGAWEGMRALKEAAGQPKMWGEIVARGGAVSATRNGLQELFGDSDYNIALTRATLPNWTMTADDAGNLALEFNDAWKDTSSVWFRAAASTATEDMSEMFGFKMGGIVGRGASDVARGAARKVPGFARVQTYYGKVFDDIAKKAPGLSDAIGELKARGGIQNAATEALEEYVGIGLKDIAFIGDESLKVMTIDDREWELGWDELIPGARENGLIFSSVALMTMVPMIPPVIAAGMTTRTEPSDLAAVRGTIDRAATVEQERVEGMPAEAIPEPLTQETVDEHTERWRQSVGAPELEFERVDHDEIEDAEVLKLIDYADDKGVTVIPVRAGANVGAVSLADGVVGINIDRSAGNMQFDLYHELLHDFRKRQPAMAREIDAALDALEGGKKRRRALERYNKRRIAKGMEPVDVPTKGRATGFWKRIAADEATANRAEELGALVALADGSDTAAKLMDDIVTNRRFVGTALMDWMADRVNSLAGTNISTSQQRKLKKLAAEVASYAEANGVDSVSADRLIRELGRSEGVDAVKASLAFNELIQGMSGMAAGIEAPAVEIEGAAQPKGKTGAKPATGEEKPIDEAEVEAFTAGKLSSWLTTVANRANRDGADVRQRQLDWLRNQAPGIYGNRNKLEAIRRKLEELEGQEGVAEAPSKRKPKKKRKVKEANVEKFLEEGGEFDRRVASARAKAEREGDDPDQAVNDFLMDPPYEADYKLEGVARMRRELGLEEVQEEEVVAEEVVEEEAVEEVEEEVEAPPKKKRKKTKKKAEPTFDQDKVDEFIEEELEPRIERIIEDAEEAGENTTDALREFIDSPPKFKLPYKIEAIQQYREKLEFDRLDPYPGQEEAVEEELEEEVEEDVEGEETPAQARQRQLEEDYDVDELPEVLGGIFPSGWRTKAEKAEQAATKKTAAGQAAERLKKKPVAKKKSKKPEGRVKTRSVKGLGEEAADAVKELNKLEQGRDRWAQRLANRTSEVKVAEAKERLEEHDESLDKAYKQAKKLAGDHASMKAPLQRFKQSTYKKSSRAAGEATPQVYEQDYEGTLIKKPRKIKEEDVTAEAMAATIESLFKRGRLKSATFETIEEMEQALEVLLHDANLELNKRPGPKERAKLQEDIDTTQRLQGEVEKLRSKGASALKRLFTRTAKQGERLEAARAAEEAQLVPKFDKNDEGWEPDPDKVGTPAQSEDYYSYSYGELISRKHPQAMQQMSAARLNFEQAKKGRVAVVRQAEESIARMKEDLDEAETSLAKMKGQRGKTKEETQALKERRQHLNKRVVELKGAIKTTDKRRKELLKDEDAQTLGLADAVKEVESALATAQRFEELRALVEPLAQARRLPAVEAYEQRDINEKIAKRMRSEYKRFQGKWRKNRLATLEAAVHRLHVKLWGDAEVEYTSIQFSPGGRWADMYVVRESYDDYGRPILLVETAMGGSRPILKERIHAQKPAGVRGENIDGLTLELERAEQDSPEDVPRLQAEITDTVAEHILAKQALSMYQNEGTNVVDVPVTTHVELKKLIFDDIRASEKDSGTRGTTNPWPYYMALALQLEPAELQKHLDFFTESKTAKDRRAREEKIFFDYPNSLREARKKREGLEHALLDFEEEVIDELNLLAAVEVTQLRDPVPGWSREAGMPEQVEEEVRVETIRVIQRVTRLVDTSRIDKKGNKIDAELDVAIARFKDAVEAARAPDLSREALDQTEADARTARNDLQKLVGDLEADLGVFNSASPTAGQTTLAKENQWLYRRAFDMWTQASEMLAGEMDAPSWRSLAEVDTSHPLLDDMGRHERLYEGDDDVDLGELLHSVPLSVETAGPLAEELERSAQELGPDKVGLWKATVIVPSAGVSEGQSVDLTVNAIKTAYGEGVYSVATRDFRTGRPGVGYVPEGEVELAQSEVHRIHNKARHVAAANISRRYLAKVRTAVQLERLTAGVLERFVVNRFADNPASDAPVKLRVLSPAYREALHENGNSAGVLHADLAYIQLATLEDAFAGHFALVEAELVHNMDEVAVHDEYHRGRLKAPPMNVFRVTSYPTRESMARAGEVEQVEEEKLAVRRLRKSALQLSDDGLLHSVPLEQGQPIQLDAKNRKAQEARFKLFDTLQGAVDLVRLVREDKRGKLTDAGQFLRKWRLHRGKSEARINEYLYEHVYPMLVRMANADITLEDMNKFLRLRHTPERNAQLESMRGAIAQTSGSARLEQARLTQGKRADYHRLGRMWDKWMAGQLKESLDSELIEPETYNTLRATYKHYAPMKFKDLSDHFGANTDVSVRGNEFHRALGSTKTSGNAFEFGLLATEAMVIRGAKAEVGRSLVEFAKDNPWANVFVNRTVTKTKLTWNKSAGTYSVIERKAKEPGGSGVIAVKEGGKTVTYTVNPEYQDLIRSLRGMSEFSDGDLIKFLGIGKLARGMSQLHTRYNPAFPFVNMPRDYLHAAYMIAGDRGAMAAVEALNPVNYGKSMQAMAKHMQAHHYGQLGEEGEVAYKAETKHDRYYQEYLASGAPVSFMNLRSFDHVAKELRKLEGGMRGKSGRGLGETIGLLNDWVENGSRFSHFVALREKGISTEEAALETKELTVNFERRGEWSKGINAFWLFSQAGLTGTHRVFRWGKKNPKAVATLLGSTVVTGMLLDMFNAAMGGEDELGRNRWDMVSQSEKDSHIIFMLGGLNEDGEPKRITIPAPWIIRWFGSFGQRLNSARRGNKFDMSGALVAAVNEVHPLGGSPTDAGLTEALKGNAMPWFARPWHELEVNRNFWGSPIYREATFEPYDLPDSQAYFDSVNPVVRNITDMLRAATLSDEEAKLGERGRAGVEINPEAVEHYLGAFSGGAGKFVGRLFDVASKATANEPIAVSDMPVLRRLYKEGYYKGKDKALAFNIKAEAKRHWDAMRAGDLAYDPELAAKGWPYEWYKSGGHLSDLLTEARKAKAVEGITAEQIALIETKEQNAIRMYLGAYYENLRPLFKARGLTLPEEITQ